MFSLKKNIVKMFVVELAVGALLELMGTLSVFVSAPDDTPGDLFTLSFLTIIVTMLLYCTYIRSDGKQSTVKIINIVAYVVALFVGFEYAADSGTLFYTTNVFFLALSGVGMIRVFGSLIAFEYMTSRGVEKYPKWLPPYCSTIMTVIAFVINLLFIGLAKAINWWALVGFPSFSVAVFFVCDRAKKWKDLFIPPLVEKNDDEDDEGASKPNDRQDDKASKFSFTVEKEFSLMCNNLQLKSGVHYNTQVRLVDRPNLDIGPNWNKPKHVFAKIKVSCVNPEFDGYDMKEEERICENNIQKYIKDELEKVLENAQKEYYNYDNVKIKVEVIAN